MAELLRAAGIDHIVRWSVRVRPAGPVRQASLVIGCHESGGRDALLVCVLRKFRPRTRAAFTCWPCCGVRARSRSRGSRRSPRLRLGHWDRLSTMGNPSGYLYRVGQTEARRLHRPAPMLPSPAPAEIAEFDPDLLPALEALSESQRVCVVLIHAYGWGQTETAELLGISPSSVRTHLKRGLDRLHRSLEVNSNAD